MCFLKIRHLDELLQIHLFGFPLHFLGCPLISDDFLEFPEISFDFLRLPFDFLRLPLTSFDFLDVLVIFLAFSWDCCATCWVLSPRRGWGSAALGAAGARRRAAPSAAASRWRWHRPRRLRTRSGVDLRAVSPLYFTLVRVEEG